MRILLAIVALTMSLHTTAQSKIDITTDEKNGSVVYAGQVSFSDLEKEKTFGWLKQGAHEYNPGVAEIDFLQQNLPRYRIITFMGTWCDDSHILIPQLQKVLSEAKYPMGELTMYAVDRSKTSADGAHAQHNISFVPTIILLRDGKEAGRITESARKSIEADLVGIIKADKE